jgi:hypothetical protein
MLNLKKKFKHIICGDGSSGERVELRTEEWASWLMLYLELQKLLQGRKDMHDDLVMLDYILHAISSE